MPRSVVWTFARFKPYAIVKATQEEVEGCARRGWTIQLLSFLTLSSLSFGNKWEAVGPQSSSSSSPSTLSCDMCALPDWATLGSLGMCRHS